MFNISKIFSYQYVHPLFGLGSLTPKTLSILAMIFPVGNDFPAYHKFTYDFCTHIICANCYWVHPLAFLAWAIAILKSCGIDFGAWSSSSFIIFATYFGSNEEFLFAC